MNHNNIFLMLVKIKCAVLLNSQDDCDVEMKYYTSLYYSDWHTECSINSTYGFSFPHLQLSDYTGLCVQLSLLSSHISECQFISVVSKVPACVFYVFIL